MAGREASAVAAVAEARALAAARGDAAQQGADEGPRLQRAAELLLALGPDIPAEARPAAARILWRLGFYEQARALGGIAELGRQAALSGEPGELLHLLAWVESSADRRELLALHQLWGQGIEARAAAQPIVRPPRDSAREAIRVGFLSSDLRHHVVAFFVQPIFQHQVVGFELFVYSSHPGPPDPVQPWFAARSKAYRQLPADDGEAARLIADDQLDILIDLGGPTAGNRPGVMAYRAAPLQASWLGYPHSLGLSTIDLLLADRWIAPPDPGLLLEETRLFRHGWICLPPAAFQDQPTPHPTAPAEHRGHVTFGTANDPYKYGPASLAAWARVLDAVPGSRFMIIRPECGAPAFRENIARHFAAGGVSADRLDFRAVRGAVRSLYAEMDIALDTFPVTGGTTTCEALWMGVPTVSLMGEGMSERLSGAILNHAGYGGLVAASVDDYVALAIRLASVPDQLTGLRRTVRDKIRRLPLGDPARFALDFYELIGAAVAERLGLRSPI